MKQPVAALLGVAGTLFWLQATAAGDPVAGKEKAAPCAACHGADGNSPSPQFPRLAGQYADYLVKALEDYRTGRRKNPVMAPFIAPLSPADMEDIAAYFSRQKNGLGTIRFKK